MAYGNVQILDYPSSQLVTIDAGPAKLQTGTFKIILTIELQDYDNTINRVEMTVNDKLANHLLKPILTSLIKQSKNYLDRIRINSKVRRSLDFIGSAWKWIAGNPDHADYNILMEKINNVLESNNRQLIINKLTNAKINEVIDNTNKISKVVKEKEEVANDLILQIKFKLEIIRKS
uniref:Retrovirus-related Env polyprotein from transposon gypsy n=1 Tax=Bactrocera latifrons TaxID=174628 RepID=A0A0K8WA11_BACLA